MNAEPEPFRRHRITVEDYHRMGEAGIFTPDSRVELIEGEIIDTPPIGPHHMSAVDRLNRSMVMGVGERAIVRVQGSVRLSGLSEPEPDLLLLVPRDDFYRNRVAGPDDVLLLVEVADTTFRYDREIKAPLYATAGVAEYWIVDLGGGRVLRHAEPVDGRCRETDTPESLEAIRPRRLEDIAFDLSPLFQDS